MDVYFDNSALNDIHRRRGISEGEVDRLRAAAKDGAFTPKLSFVNIDEALAALVNHQPLALNLLRLIDDFFGLDRMLKPPDKLLTDDFVDLAFGDPPRPAEVQMPIAIRDNMEQLLRADARAVARFVEAAAAARDQINEQWEGLRRARDQARAELASPVNGGSVRMSTFGRYWREVAPALLEAYADKVGVWRKCRDEVGIERLLATPSVGMMVGANASMIYAVVVESRASKRGDPRDQQHALMASAADVFVTSDAALRHIVERVPRARPTVVDLSQFLVNLGIRAGGAAAGARSREGDPTRGAA